MITQFVEYKKKFIVLDHQINIDPIEIVSLEQAYVLQEKNKDTRIEVCVINQHGAETIAEVSSKKQVDQSTERVDYGQISVSAAKILQSCSHAVIKKTRKTYDIFKLDTYVDSLFGLVTLEIDNGYKNIINKFNIDVVEATNILNVKNMCMLSRFLSALNPKNDIDLWQCIDLAFTNNIHGEIARALHKSLTRY